MGMDDIAGLGIWILILNSYYLNGLEDYSTPRRYVLNLTQTAWHDARTSCAQTGGHLATLYDLSTVPDLDIHTVLQETAGLFWVGLNKNSKGTWSWDNGDDVGWQNWNADIVSTGNCATAKTEHPYDWYGQPCQERLPYLCQYVGGECRFIEVPDASIAAHNYMYLYQMTAEQCKDVCSKSTDFICQSFEYLNGDGRCQFNSGNRWTLPKFYSSHSGWTYYHRSCNSVEITGELLELPPSTTSVPIRPSSTISIESSSIAIECSEIFMTTDVFVTHKIFITQTVPISQVVPVTRDVIETRDVFVTQKVVLTETILVTSTTTKFETSTHIITPSSLFVFPSASVYQDPVEELKEIGEIVKERQKNLKKISVDDKRPSATYVGYVAVLFLSLVFGSIVMFDLLTIFRNRKCCKKPKIGKKTESIEVQSDGVNMEIDKWDWTRFKSKGKHSTDSDTDLTCKISDKLQGSKADIETLSSNEERNEEIDNTKSIVAKDCDTNNETVQKQAGKHTNNRLWRYQFWSVGDSGFDGSDTISDTSANEKDSFGFEMLSTSNAANNNETVSVDIEYDGDLEKSNDSETSKTHSSASDINELDKEDVNESRGTEEKHSTYF